MDVLYLFLILFFAALLMGFVAACARLAPNLAPKQAASKNGASSHTNGGRP